MPEQNDQIQPKNYNIKDVFVCMASSDGYNQEYRNLAKALGKRLAENGFSLVYGGGDVGLMGILSNAVRRYLGKIKAVITEAFAQNPDDKNPVDDDTEVVKRLSERKEKMILLAGASIIIPGGVGTVDEMMEVFAFNDMMRFENGDAPIHPLIIINEGGFYNPILEQIVNTIEVGYTNIEKCRSVFIVQSADEAIDLLKQFNLTTHIPVSCMFKKAVRPQNLPSSFEEVAQDMINRRKRERYIEEKALSHAKEMARILKLAP